ncbi:hypothetical protein M407DRAFT_245174 [Tulasnella calospora MUT 4182]|uniref:Uncharacterized protein n=1 Tax=Tulasnella calospora MUT 4182 TaxID=1051891 RepID=A0A0C3LMA3_9AGAM|nr:hypothetical protein M407DRAFT_245174 [Tulasnella calospora MUT 4182]
MPWRPTRLQSSEERPVMRIPRYIPSGTHCWWSDSLVPSTAPSASCTSERRPVDSTLQIFRHESENAASNRECTARC